MEQKTTVYVQLDTDKQVKVEMTHETEGVGAPHEVNRERELTVREMKHVTARLAQGDFTLDPNF